MRTKAQIDLDMQDGILDYTHEEWHMYNNIPKSDCAQCNLSPEKLAEFNAKHNPKLLKPCCRQCYDGEHTRVKYCSCLCHEDEMAD